MTCPLRVTRPSDNSRIVSVRDAAPSFESARDNGTMPAIGSFSRREPVARAPGARGSGPTPGL
jgi:hypothetical protein